MGSPVVVRREQASNVDTARLCPWLCCIKDNTEFLYKTTDYYAPQYERCIRWDDPAIGIEWPITQSPILSAKDQQGLPLSQAEVF